MKNLYKPDFAEINARFICKKPGGTAETVKTSLEKMNAAAKAVVSEDLAILDKNTLFAEAKKNAHDELNEYRKLLLENKTKPNLTEDFVSNIITNTVQESDRNHLELDLGIKMSISNEKNKNEETDSDEVFDLDEFAESQRFTSEYLMTIIQQLSKDGAPNTPQIKNIKAAFTDASSEIEGLITKLALTNPDENTKEKIQDSIQALLIQKLKTHGVDIGIMLEEFAKLARTHNSPNDIDAALQKFVEEFENPKLPSNDKEIVSDMERLYEENKEIAHFLAEYYPPRNFDLDITNYNKLQSKDKNKVTKGTYKKTLPEFFWSTSLSENGSIAEQMENFTEAENGYETLRTKILNKENNKAESIGLVNGIVLSAKDIFTGSTSNMPNAFRHFKFNRKDVKKAGSVEELFKNKMKDLLKGRSISFDKVKQLARPLDWEKDIDMLQRLTGDIAVEYDDDKDNFGEKYRQALKDGKTRKTWQEWLDKDSGVTKMTRVGNSLKNWIIKLARLMQSLGLFPDLTAKYLKDKKDKYAGESVLQKELTTAKGDIETEKEQNKKKKEWLKPKNKHKREEFIKFNQNKDYSKYLDFLNPSITDIDSSNKTSGDLGSEFGETSPDEFATWKSTESVKLLEWIKVNPTVTYEKISITNWMYLVENRNKLTPTTKKDKKGKTINILKLTKNPPREITSWTNEAIENMSKDSGREKAFNKLQNPEEGEKDAILGAGVQYDFFTKHKNELFSHPEDSDSGTFKEPFASLFKLDRKFYKEKLTSNDLSILINNSNKLRGGVKTANEKDETNYYNDDGEKIKDGEKKNTFEVDIKWTGTIFTTDPYQDFTSVKGLVRYLNNS